MNAVGNVDRILSGKWTAGHAWGLTVQIIKQFSPFSWQLLIGAATVKKCPSRNLYVLLQHIIFYIPNKPSSGLVSETSPPPSINYKWIGNWLAPFSKLVNHPRSSLLNGIKLNHFVQDMKQLGEVEFMMVDYLDKSHKRCKVQYKNTSEKLTNMSVTIRIQEKWMRHGVKAASKKNGRTEEKALESKNGCQKIGFALTQWKWTPLPLLKWDLE